MKKKEGRRKEEGGRRKEEGGGRRRARLLGDLCDVQRRDVPAEPARKNDIVLLSKLVKEFELHFQLNQ